MLHFIFERALLYVDQPQNAVAQIETAYLPTLIYQLNSKATPSHKIGKQFFTVSSPDKSTLVCITAHAPKKRASMVTNIESSALGLLVSDNAKLTAVSRASDEANIANMQANAQQIKTSLQNTLDQEKAAQSEFGLLKKTDALLQRQIEKIQNNLSMVLPLTARSSTKIQSNATALTTIIQSNQVSQEQRHLFALQMQRAVSLPKEQISLQNQIKALQRKQVDLVSQQATTSAQIQAAKSALSAIQATHVVRPPSPSTFPVGPSNAVIVALGAFLGLLLGIFAAFLRSAMKAA
ncbi:hypothetical protein [Acidithiobacillus acidisediminis]|uniref:hypothetical protein n=1 Tax=Acidithiobacillus acidisediminis TaxID=2937799 RepID=UPI00200F4A3A|nr:hypothetical protein [Acidithiobacillus sp. S30A2]